MIQSIPFANFLPFIGIIFLSTLISCSATEPIQQEPIDESEYFDPADKNLNELTSYSAPKMRPGHERRLRIQIPYSVMRRGVEGDLVLRLYINEFGEVDYAAVEESLTGAIDYPMQRRILSEKFTPARLNGKPVKSVYRYERGYYIVETVRRVNN